jgi:hypothetical protein
MKIYSTIKVNNRLHVLREISWRYADYPLPDYRETGKALAGIVKKGETLNDWLSKPKPKAKKK